MNRSDTAAIFHRSTAAAGLQRLAAWLALFALLFNLAGGLAPMAAQAAVIDDGLHALCTSGGIMAQDDSGKPAPEHASGGVSCAFCLPLLHGAAVPVAALQPAAPVQVATLAVPAPSAPVSKSRPAAAPASPRAPPL